MINEERDLEILEARREAARRAYLSTNDRAAGAAYLAEYERVDQQIVSMTGARSRTTKGDPKAMADASRDSGQDAQWALVEQHAKYFRTMLLYGIPGTGKSHLARFAGVNGGGVFPVPIHQDLPAAELRGHFIPSQEYDEERRPIGNPILRWADGPATMAWRCGGRLILDEIDHAGDDALSFLLAILDNFETARLVLGTTGEILSPHPDFTCWATMNGELEDLPPALRDRFPVAVRITQPNPKAIAALPDDIQGIARQMVVAEDDDRRIGLRKWMEYAKLREDIGEDAAGTLVFTPEKWNELKPAIKLGHAVDPR